MRVPHLLTYLTPAEVLVLQNYGDAKKEELLKYTFLDLVIRDVLKIEKVEQVSGKLKGKVLDYISVGKRHYGFLPHKHEEYFIKPFKKNPNAKILMINYIRMCLRNAPFEKALRREIMKSRELFSLFTITRFLFFFSSIRPTPSAITIQNNLKEEFDYLKSLKDSGSEEKLVQLLNYAPTLKGNMLLVLPKQELKELEEKFDNYIREKSSSGEDGWWYIHTGGNHYSSSTEFYNDTSFSGETGSGESSISDWNDSVFSSDSASGCGGCGGCGGD